MISDEAKNRWILFPKNFQLSISGITGNKQHGVTRANVTGEGCLGHYTSLILFEKLALGKF